DYSSEPNGALSWRFIRKLAGSGVLGDLMGHLTDLIHYMVGPIAEVNGITSTIHTERPVQQMGTGTHFDVIEGGEKKPVENEDYAGMIVRLADNAVASGAVGTLEASRVAVGPRCRYTFEIFGTEGSVIWDFERMNELEIAMGRTGQHQGYQRVMATPSFGDFGAFQPGPGPSMGYDDLKVIEAKKFLLSYLGKESKNSNIHDAVAAARVNDAVEESMKTKQWVSIKQAKGTTAATK
ncbi:MAG: Gfo/Idh/MocA family oxidoreductase, partial [Rhodoluna sp.]